MSDVVFLKLGGSLLTDKTGVEAVRPEVLARLAAEIHRARQVRPDLRLVLGHGSGSFGHRHAARHGTRQGVRTAAQWRGLAEVSDAAARLNRLVCRALLEAGVPAISLQPSASVRCQDGRIVSLAVAPVQDALAAGLAPLLYGDVAFDLKRGATIISTEEILSYLAGELRPRWFLLAGETTGVLDQQGQVVSLITPETLAGLAPALGGSRGTDVTGGMAAKVQAMMELVEAHPGLSIRIFSGLAEGVLEAVLSWPDVGVGTVIRATAVP